MNRRRLQKLADFLSETKFQRGKFNLAVWMCDYERALASSFSDTQRDVLQKLQEKAGDGEAFDDNVRPIHCRTVGCAMGWAATIPSFRKAGLELRFGQISPLDTKPGKSTVITYQGEEGYSAASLFFDVEYYVACILFGPDYYTVNQWTQPKAVAKRIYELLEKGQEAFDEKYYNE